MQLCRTVVFVGDSSPTIQATLKERLEREGVQPYLSRSAINPSSPTEFIGGFKCALMTLERLSGADDPVDEAELLRMYQPDLPVGFLHTDASLHMLERAAAMGPVFRKSDQLDTAIAWVLANAGK